MTMRYYHICLVSTIPHHGRPTLELALLTRWTMKFPDRLARLRKQKGLTQQALAKFIGCSPAQLHRYEAGTSQPPLDILRKLATALQVSGDTLLFDDAERGPDEEFRLQFEALTQFNAEERRAAKALLDALILKHQARKWAHAS
jgi:transcriptional regulator with XRE-family HTH domain